MFVKDLAAKLNYFLYSKKISLMEITIAASAVWFDREGTSENPGLWLMVDGNEVFKLNYENSNS